MGDGFEISRGECGVPHIAAEDAAGAFRGLGYAHGKDRGMQALFMRILGQGRLSELLDSSDASLAIDLFFRKMNWYGLRGNQFDLLSPEAHEILDAYCDGMNAALREKPPWTLRVLGYKPEPWTPQDSVLLIRMTGYLTLTQSQAEVERLFVEMVQAGVPDTLLDELFPGAAAEMDRELIEQITLEEPFIVPPDLWQTGAPRLMASNNWVLSGEKTRSGSPILANDPHLETNRLPNIWYEAILTHGDRYGMGATMPGIPGLLVGRTRSVAIGATYSFMDAVDSWIERCKEGSYMRDGEGWKPFGRREETILRKRKDPVTVVFYENDHGVLEGDPSGPEEHFRLTTRWTGSEAGAESLNAITGVWFAQTVEQAMEAIGPAAISFSWVLADRDGSIGFQMSGHAPTRRPGASGLVPLPGWRPENDWRGFVAPEDLPRALNPTDGMIITSNQDLNAFGNAPVINMPMAPYRADRIRELLTGNDQHKAEDMNRIQGDLYSLEAAAFMEILRPVLPDTESARVLREWDCRYDADSHGAYLFERFYEALRAEVFGRAGLGEEAELYIGRQTGIYTDFYLNFDRVLLSQRSAWFGTESGQDVFRRIASEVLTGQSRPWGETRHVTMSHVVFGGRLPRFLGFDGGPVTLPGSRATVQQGQIYRSAGRVTTFAPSLRLATDMSQDVLHSNLAGGPSEHRFSRWYLSDLDRWVRNEYKELLPTPAGRRLKF